MGIEESVQFTLTDLRLFDNAAALILYFDKTELCQYANPASCKFFGKKNDQLIGKISLRNLLGELNYIGNHSLIQNSLNGDKQNLELSLPLFNGEVREVLITLLPYNLDNTTVGLFVHASELLGAKSLETPRPLFDAKSSNIFKDFLENSPMPAWIVDEFGIVHYLNVAYKKAKPQVTVGEKFFKSFTAEIADAYQKTNQEILASRNIASNIERLTDSSGKEIIYKTVKFPLFYNNSYMIGGYAIDMTELLVSPESNERIKKIK